jgi:septal ring factor EnvC (AmiA/AmiB activator)
LQRNLVQYQALAEDLRITVAQTDVIRRQIEGLASQMRDRRAAVGRLAAESYRSHRADSFNLLLDSRSATDFRDRLALLNVFAQHRQQEIKALSTTTERYAAAQRTLDALIAQQRGQQQELLAQRRKIQTRLAELRPPPAP